VVLVWTSRGRLDLIASVEITDAHPSLEVNTELSDDILSSIIFLFVCRSTAFNGFVFSFACPGKMNPWDMLVVTNEFYFSDWLFLYYLARNMEPYLFRQMLLEHIIPEIQSLKSSQTNLHESDASDDNESDAGSAKLKESEVEEEDLENHSLNSDDMAIVPASSLVAVNEKHVKFV
jgi:hypothetical protein